MKKVVYLSMAFLSFLLVLTGCGKKATTIDGKMEDLIAKLYDGIDENDLPMYLENIDYYFSNFDKQTILENLKSYDSVIEIHNNPKISIKKLINGHLVSDKYLEIYTDKNYLEFNILDLLCNEETKERNINILKNKLEAYLKRTISPNFHEFIILLNSTLPRVVLEQELNKLSYGEIRIIRGIIVKEIGLKESLEKGKNILSRNFKAI